MWPEPIPLRVKLSMVTPGVQIGEPKEGTVPGATLGGLLRDGVDYVVLKLVRGFSPGTPVSSPPSLVYGSASRMELNECDLNSVKLNS